MPSSRLGAAPRGGGSSSTDPVIATAIIAATAAVLSNKENAAQSNSCSDADKSSETGTMGKGQPTKECSACHLSLPKLSYSNAQWKKSASVRRCADCVRSGNTAGAVAAAGNSESNKGGLSERTVAESAPESANLTSVGNAMDVQRLTAALSFEPESKQGDDGIKNGQAIQNDDANLGAASGSIAHEQEADLNAKTSAAAAEADVDINVSVLTVEQTPVKKNIGPGSSFGLVGTYSTTGKAGDEAEYTPVTANGTDGLTVRTGFTPTEQDESAKKEDDPALFSAFSFSLYEAEATVEHIRRLQEEDEEGKAREVLSAADDALSLPCFKREVIADMLGEHIQKAAAREEAQLGNLDDDEFVFANDSGASTEEDSPVHLNGIDSHNLAHLYSSLQLAAIESELHLGNAQGALDRIVTACQRSSLSWVCAVDFGHVLEEAFEQLNDERSDHVEDLVSRFDDATSGVFDVRGSAEIFVETLADVIVHPSYNEEQPSEGTSEELRLDNEDDRVSPVEATDDGDVPPIKIAKHVTFSPDEDASQQPESPVEKELEVVGERKIVSSILTSGDYPHEVAEGSCPLLPDISSDINACATDCGSHHRPDVLQNVYNAYRGAYGAGKDIPVAGLLLHLAEGTVSTGIRVASLGKADLKTVDENLVGPHIVKGVDDLLINPVVETVGGVIDGAIHIGGEIVRPVAGVVGAVASVIPFVGHRDDDHGGKEVRVDFV